MRWEETRTNKSTGNIIDVKTFQGKFTLRSVTQPDPAAFFRKNDRLCCLGF